MKLCNFASLDPVQRDRGIRGLANAARRDREMWDEFQSNLITLGPASEQLLHDLFTHDNDREVDFTHRDRIRLESSEAAVTWTGPTESSATVIVRRGQQFFRQSVLNAYDIRCCISGINVPRLLVASHIKPWKHFPADRVDPRNGLCLSCIHDAAFDSGLITLDEKYRVVLSKRLSDYLPQRSLEENFVAFAGKSIRMPDKLARPDSHFLKYHRDTVFAR